MYKPLGLKVPAALAHVEGAQQQVLHGERAGSFRLGPAFAEEVLQITSR